MMINLSSYLLCFAILIVAATTEGTRTLKLVQMLYRHGDRAPIDLYPNDPNPVSSWPLGLGELTMIGRKQHFGLGKYLRATYKDLLTTNPVEINVQSSDCNRCLDSAESNLAAFYAPKSPWKFENEANWQPIPIRYVPKNEDRYLECDSYCPRATAERDNLVNTPEGKAFIAKHKEMFDNLTLNSGNPITEWTNASYLFDVLWIEKQYNLTVPKWAEPWWHELDKVADMSFKWKFNSPVIHRLRAGPLIGRIIEKMQDKINGASPVKFQVYSGHDTNVAVVLNALNLFNDMKPPYCATLLFELYSGDEDAHYVRMLYLNSTEPEKITQTPHLLVLNGCTEFCPLEYFINYTKHLIPDDWIEECKLPEPIGFPLKFYALSFIVLIAIFLSSVCLYFFFKWCSYKSRDEFGYSPMATSYS